MLRVNKAPIGMTLVALHNGLMVGGYSHPLMFWNRVRLTAGYAFYINRLGEQTLFFLLLFAANLSSNSGCVSRWFSAQSKFQQAARR